MAVDIRLDDLKPYVKQAILHGDFLLSINVFSDVWIYLRRMNVEPARQLIKGVLMQFWRNYLEQNDEDYVLLALDHPSEFSEDELPTAFIADEAVTLLENPRLRFKRVLVDPEDSELFVDEFPSSCNVTIFVALSIHLDLLKQVIALLREKGYVVSGVITVLERERISGPEIRDKLQVELIPMLVYEETQDRLYAVTELTENPYRRYHRYFSS